MEWTATAASSKKPLAVQAPMPHSTEILAPRRSEIRPAQGRLRKVAMYWMLMTRPGQHRAVPHAQMDIGGKDGERQADGQVDHEAEERKGQDLRGVGLRRSTRVAVETSQAGAPSADACFRRRGMNLRNNGVKVQYTGLAELAAYSGASGSLPAGSVHPFTVPHCVD